MRYPLLIDPAKIVDWAQRLVFELERERAGTGRILRPAMAANAVLLDLKEASTFIVTLDDDLTTLTSLLPRATDEVRFDWRLVLIQDGTGSHAVTWPTAWRWVGGVAPTVTSAADAIDIFDFTIFDGLYHGSIFGQDMQVVIP